MAIHINKVYTRSGDKGETGLIGGVRVPKDDLRVQCYGSTDELSAYVGLARGVLDAEDPLGLLLLRLQNELFDLGSELATPPGKLIEGMRQAHAEDVVGLETLIDQYNEGLGKLESFILPGGGQVSCMLHLARTVCRRVERLMVTLDRRDRLREEAMQYINRLSDLLFVLARYAAQSQGESEALWVGGLGSKAR